MRGRAFLFGAAIFGAGCLPFLLPAGSVAAPPPRASISQDALLAGFRDPPPAARPRVWWHWMNGNITKKGIRLDLEWMKRIGLGGVNIIDAAIDTPQVVAHRLVFMTPAWKDAFRYAVGLAGKMGMEVSIDASPGWSETGGPWVTPQQAMKKLVWSVTPVEGPFHGVLPRPPAVPGRFGDLRDAPAQVPDFYRDSIVIAYRVPTAPPAIRAITSNAGAVDGALLHDGKLTDGVTLKPAGPEQSVWLRVAYAEPVRLQGLTLAVATNPGEGLAARVEVSDDGTHWRFVAAVPKPAQIRRFALAQQTISFAPVTGRYFRLVLRPDAPMATSLRLVEWAPGAINPAPLPVKPQPRFYRVCEMAFHAGATVNQFEKKAGFAIARDNYAIAGTPQFAPGSAIDPHGVIDLTARMKPGGRLDWTPPPGRWIVLRMGYSLIGAQNHPATPEATGLEVDKLDRMAVRDYLQHYLALYKDVTGPALFGAHGLDALTVDSSEIGAQNWTANILADFRRLRGYDPTPWLPALTGAVVQSPQASNKFLWDFRRTLAQLLAENHYGEIAAVARAQGLTSYGEALEDHRPGFGDDMEMRQYADIPMGAMWTYVRRPAWTYIADLRGAASVAHLYGRALTGAESLTSAGRPWADSPRTLKPIIDLEFALGVNRVVIHTSVHQPVDRPPGLSLFQYGQFFDRLESWADEARPWIQYIARCSYLLQQGQPIADVAYFYGQEAPITGLFGDKPVRAVPPGYAFDFVDSDALLHRLSVDDHALVTETGMRYRVLYLGGSASRMTLAVLRRIRDLVANGAVLVGKRPLSSPSLADDPAAFQALAASLFGAGGTHPYGKGMVFASGTLADALGALHVPPDFTYSKPQADIELLFAHRKLANGDLYFVTNRRDKAQKVAVSFRSARYRPQIWDAVTGQVHAVQSQVVDGRTKLVLALPAYGSAFVLFRGKSEAAPPARVPGPVVARITGPWQIAFQPGRGAPAKITQDHLQSWSGSKIPGVKYFSGTATYSTTVTLPRIAPGTHLLLDLGAVRELARVSLNGKPLGIVWTPPFTLDMTAAAKPGRNLLRIAVTNLWVNRLIGDAQPGAVHKYTFTTVPTYRANAPLRESGLLGPVFVRRTQ
jgi:hypothetical protein